jgi:hypothetical protein
MLSFGAWRTRAPRQKLHATVSTRHTRGRVAPGAAGLLGLCVECAYCALFGARRGTFDQGGAAEPGQSAWSFTEDAVRAITRVGQLVEQVRAADPAFDNHWNETYAKPSMVPG